MTGTIRDPTGAAVLGANVTVSGGNTASRTTQTIEDGIFVFPDLPGGTYTLKVELDGFAPLELRDVFIQNGKITRHELTLTDSASNEEIIVTSETPLITAPKDAVLETTPDGIRSIRGTFQSKTPIDKVD